ncbi:group II intron reverse transcriptase/maturase [Vibrio parahaemolyticus]|nr:group II intron reverse transcriptase/maturase [Vibrio parahaemolyticus]
MSLKDINRIERIRELNSKNPKWINRDLYRLLYRRDLYIIAYESLKSGAGNMTAGSDGETIDGFSSAKIDRIINSIKDESFRFNPARRVEIPKANGKTRPLGIASPLEKVVQQVLLFILEAIYEPTFSDRSHGFRNKRGCHTALQEFRNNWSGINWVIEGDIKGFFDNISHEILIDILKERIDDERFINLIRKALSAGYLEFGRSLNSIVGTPQGSVVSPILANIYLDKFDKWVEEEIIRKYETGDHRKVNPERRSLQRRRIRLKKKISETENEDEVKTLRTEIKEISKKLETTPKVVDDGSYIRIKYIRYADDWIIGVNGSRELASEIRDRCADFLTNMLELELSFEKTHIRHAKTEYANFLGTFIKVGNDAEGKKATLTSKNGHRYTKTVTGWLPNMVAPTADIVKRLADRGICHSSGKPKSKGSWAQLDDIQIVELYSSIWRGYLNYYSFVDNRSNLRRIQYILQYGCAKTLADKHRSSVRKIFKKHGFALKVEIKDGNNEVIRVTQFPHHRSLARQPNNFLVTDSTVNDGGKAVMFHRFRTRSKLDAPCCICGETENIEMHHVRHIRKIGDKVKGFTRVMQSINRKQIPVCQPCHSKIHNGKYDGMSLSNFTHPHIASA